MKCFPEEAQRKACIMVAALGKESLAPGLGMSSRQQPGFCKVPCELHAGDEVGWPSPPG